MAPGASRGRAWYRRSTMNPSAAPRKPRACKPPPALQETPDPRPVEGPSADEELAHLSKAVGHPARVAILRLLVRREACICGDIVDELPLAQSTVSQHLKELREAGLIRGEIDGPRTCYCLDRRAMAEAGRIFAGVFRRLTPPSRKEKP